MISTRSGTARTRRRAASTVPASLNAGTIEILDMGQLETGSFEGRDELITRVTAMVAESAIDRAIQRGQSRNEEDQPPSGFEEFANRGKRSDVVLDMFQNIETDDRVKVLSGDGTVVMWQIQMRH